MSREYNQGILPDYPIQQRLHKCFGAYIGGDEEKVKEGIRKAEFIQKGRHTFYSASIKDHGRSVGVETCDGEHADG